MDRAAFDRICETMPGARKSGRGELDSWKIGGKMFVCYGDWEELNRNIETVVVAVADKDTAEMLIDAGAAHKPPYFRGAWVGLTLAQIDEAEALHRIEAAYDRVRSGLTKKAQADLPAWEK